VHGRRRGLSAKGKTRKIIRNIYINEEKHEDFCKFDLERGEKVS
jgi:hypothetical protein